MATIIQQPAALEFSSILKDVVFGSSADHSVVSVIITASGVTQTVFQETLFPSEGTIRLEEMPDLIEPYARQHLAVSMSVRIDEFDAAGTATATLTTTPSVVLFSTCDVGEDAQTFVTNHFLTILNGTKVTTMGCEERLYAYNVQQVSVTGTYFDGTVITEKTVTLGAAATTNGISAFFVSPADIDVMMAMTGDLVEYLVVAGERRQHFKVRGRKVEPAPSLAFINSFGCTEFIHCFGTHQKDSKYTRSSGRFRGLLRNFRIVEDRQFKADTGWLNTPMADWADDLFRSQEVYLWVDGTVGRQVVVTDSQSVISDDDDHMPSFTFTYVYAQKLHNVMQRTHAGRIFDNTFDHTFN